MVQVGVRQQDGIDIESLILEGFKVSVAQLALLVEPAVDQHATAIDVEEVIGAGHILCGAIKRNLHAVRPQGRYHRYRLRPGTMAGAPISCDPNDRPPGHYTVMRR